MSTLIWNENKICKVEMEFKKYLLRKGQVLEGSTDVSDVLWYTPLGDFSRPFIQNVATSGMSIGHKGMIATAQIMTLTALEFINDPELVKKACEEFEKTTKKRPYKSPFPEGHKPPFHRLKDMVVDYFQLY